MRSELVPELTTVSTCCLDSQVLLATSHDSKPGEVEEALPPNVCSG
jgi:hypothetical protein